MIHNLIKYTICLPFLLLLTVIALFIGLMIGIIEVFTSISSGNIPDKHDLIKNFLIKAWKPI